MKYCFVTSKELGSCPAAVDMNTGIIEINKDVWNNYSEAEKRFIIAHEEAHYNLDTDDEQEADTAAIRKVAGTCNKSLSAAVGTLYKAGVIDEDRIVNAYTQALKEDARLGNLNAKKELENLEKMEDEIIDNNEETETSTEEQKETRTRRDGEFPKMGIKAFGCFFSWECIGMAIIAFLLVKIIKKN